MSGFVFVTVDPERATINMERPTLAFTKKGMLLTLEIRGSSYVLRLFANASHDPAQVLSQRDGGRFCTYVGTLIYHSRTGKQATAAILQDVLQNGIQCIDSAIGNFCVMIDDGRQLHVVTDRAGLHHVYRDRDLSLVTNSYISAASAVTGKTFQTQEVLEYILLGATFGSNTLLDEIKLHDSEQSIRVRNGVRESVSRGHNWTANVDCWRHLTLQERLCQALDTADDYYGQIARTYGERVTAALSGGYDSRLSLGLLLRHGVKPALFVYGPSTNIDVRIAKAICRGEQLELSHLDRGSRCSMEPDEYWNNQEDVFHGLDGLTQYGFACEPFEVSHRRERVSGGQIAINGGGGEIWRDFWKVPDRAMSAHEFVRAYFSGRFSGLAASACARIQFLRNLATKIEEIVGEGNVSLTSPVVQSLYARLRLRFWQGKNNSVDNHVGYAITPFSEERFSIPAMWIPLAAKRNGWFERQMIRRVSFSLARYPSSHGYDFENGPSAFERAKEMVTRNLPICMRAGRRRLSLRRSRFYFHSDRYVQARFGAGPLEVQKYVNLSQLGDTLAFSRALTIERMLRGEWV